MMLDAAKAGVAFMAMPVGKHNGDPNDPKVQTELAAFLVAAGTRAYYGTSSPHNTSFQRLPIHDKRIGKPLGDAVIHDGVFYRSFAAGVNVTYDTKSETGTIQWAGDSTSPAPHPPTPSPQPPPATQRLHFLSAVFGDGMVLQSAPQQALFFGHTAPGATVSTLFNGKMLLPNATADANGPWTQSTNTSLPPA